MYAIRSYYEHILALHDLGSHGLLPDLTIVIDAPLQDVSNRLAIRDVVKPLSGRPLEAAAQGSRHPGRHAFSYNFV